MGKGKEHRRLTIADTVTYSLGSLGREVSNNLVVVFFMAYLTTMVGLNGILLGILFCIAKLWDAVNDIIMATLVNNTKSRFGKYRPWIFIGAFANAFAIIAMFAPISQVISSQFGLYIYYMGMYIIWGMTFTAVDVPFWSMIPTIANSTKERDQVTSLAKLIGGFGGFIVSTMGTLILSALGKNDIKSYMIMACVGAGLFLIFIIIMVICNKERYQLPSQNVSFKEVFGIFKSNDQLVPYAISYVLFITGTTIALFQILYLFIYEDALGRISYEHYGLFTGLACTGQGIAMFFYPWLSKKLSANKIYGANYFMGMAGMLFMFLIFFVIKADYGFGQVGAQWVNIIIISVAGSLLMTANGLNQIGSTTMIANIVDYGEHKTGRRSDSLMFSVQTLLTKFAGAIAMLVLGIGVEVAHLPTINPITESFEGEITTQMMTILRVFMFLIPIPLLFAGYLVYKKKYTLHGQQVEDIKAELDKLHNFDGNDDIVNEEDNKEIILNNTVEIDNQEVKKENQVAADEVEEKKD